MTAKKKEPAFGEALAEVEAILERLENDAVDIDELSAEVRRAAELIQLCRRKLEKTETEVRDLVAVLAPEDAGTAAGGAGDAGDTGADGDTGPAAPPAGDALPF